MNVLVTGGAGLLGAAVVHRLLAVNERVTVMDLAPGPERLSDVLEQIEYVVGDIADRALLESIIERCKPEAIYHLGALLGAACDDDPPTAMRVNVVGLFDLMELARIHSVRQVLFASSVTTMGLDIADSRLTDATLQRPLSMYGVSKLFGEGLGRFYRRKYGIDFRSLRYPSIVGRGARLGGIFTFTSDMVMAAKAGETYTVKVAENTRTSVLYDDDAARALIELGNAPLDRIRTLNYLVDGIQPQLTAGEMAQRVHARFPNARIDFQPFEEWQPLIDMLAVPIDDSRARAEWGWQPKYDYDRIIEMMVEERQ